jgi:hypothetical protein
MLIADQFSFPIQIVMIMFLRKKEACKCLQDKIYQTCSMEDDHIQQIPSVEEDV